MTEIKEVYEIVKDHVGKENPITSAEIASRLGIDEDATTFKTRGLILEVAKQYRLPIAGNSRGYFVINTEEELNRYVDNLNSRIAGIEERKRMITENFRKN